MESEFKFDKNKPLIIQYAVFINSLSLDQFSYFLAYKNKLAEIERELLKTELREVLKGSQYINEDS